MNTDKNKKDETTKHNPHKGPPGHQPEKSDQKKDETTGSKIPVGHKGSQGKDKKGCC
jgi:hypothetical protein